MKKIYVSLMILSLGLASSEAELQKGKEKEILVSAETELTKIHRLVDDYLKKPVLFNELESNILKLIGETENLKLKLHGFAVLEKLAFKETLYEQARFYKSLHYECLEWLGDDFNLEQSYAYHLKF